MPAIPAASDVRIRRATCLVGYWDERDFVLENPLTAKSTTVAPAIAELLCVLGEPAPPVELAARLRAVPDVETLISKLVERDVLLVEDSPVERKDRLVAERWAWGPETRYFHFATQHVPFGHDAEEQRTELAERARTRPPPAPTKAYDGEAIELPGAFTDGDGEPWDALRARRTRRSFGNGGVSLDAVSRVLLWTWGVTEERADSEYGAYVLKTSPSGGARHPIEVYPLVLAVEGLEPGFYHYSAGRHALEPLRLGSFADLAVELCHGQPWAGEAAALFFMTALVERSMWKYRYGHAYRVLLLDAGHLGQTFHLVCTKLGLGPFTTAATDDRAVERELGLDGVSEIALYTAAVGLPAD